MSTSPKMERFEYVFSDESSQRKLTFDYGAEDDELLRFGTDDGGEVFLGANRSGFLALAKICIKLAMGEYKPGYHLHVGEDFSATGLTITLLEDEAASDGQETPEP